MDLLKVKYILLDFGSDHDLKPFGDPPDSLRHYSGAIKNLGPGARQYVFKTWLYPYLAV